jgi:hypothetical protein
VVVGLATNLLHHTKLSQLLRKKVEGAGIEAAKTEQSLDDPRGVSPRKSANSADLAGTASGVSESLAASHCHTVTLSLEDALRALDQGRLDLAREAIRNVLSRLREQ